MPSLTYRRSSEDGYRVSFDGVEIGSISLQRRHTKSNASYWRWGVDIMPLMDHGGRPPVGEVDVDRDKIEAGFHEALQAFKTAFNRWPTIAPEQWTRNLEHKRHGQERWRG